MNREFKIHCFAVCKNEADIVAYTLRKACAWADGIYVMDNGSTDGTWEEIQKEARANPKVVPWKSDGKPFSDGLRGEVFNAFRSRAQDGDWWCRLDSDEEYVDDPRAFLGGLPRRHQVVWGAAIEYYLDPGTAEAMDASWPIERVLENLKWYQAVHSEPRFFRYRKGLAWPGTASWPRHMGVASPRRIRYKHYKYRSPAQSQLRLDTRRDTHAAVVEGWDHWRIASWKDAALANIGELHEDRRDGAFVVDEHRMPPVEPSAPRKWAKYAMHRLGIWP